MQASVHEFADTHSCQGMYESPLTQNTSTLLLHYSVSEVWDTLFAAWRLTRTGGDCSWHQTRMRARCCRPCIVREACVYSAPARRPDQHACSVRSVGLRQVEAKRLPCRHKIGSVRRLRLLTRSNSTSALDLRSMTVNHAVGESVVVPGLKLTDHTFQVRQSSSCSSKGHRVSAGFCVDAAPHVPACSVTVYRPAVRFLGRSTVGKGEHALAISR